MKRFLARAFRVERAVSRRGVWRGRLAVETMEDRAVPSAAGPSDVFLQSSPQLLNTPDDPDLAGMYNLAKIQAEHAWDITTGRADVVVADIDSGIDYTHPDLYLNVWINQDEIPDAVRTAITSDPDWDVDGDGLITFYDLNDPRNQGAGKITDLNGNGYIDGGDLLVATRAGGWADGIDEDPFTINGRSYPLVDDLIGWDFRNNDNDPFDTLGHGTHTAGTIGAVGDNGVGVVGVNWAVSIMSLRFIGDTNSDGSIAGAIDSLYYAVHHDVRVSNNSWRVYGFNQPLYEAIQFAGNHGHVFVAAAGNDGFNNDKSPLRAYPASFDLANIIAVAATDSKDAKASWSNYGKTSVDLGAPGVSVLSTVPLWYGDHSGYGYGWGTSMAAPHVAGTVGLILADAKDHGQNLTVAQIKAKILNSVDHVRSLDGKTVSGGRLNAWKALLDSAPSSPTGRGGVGNGNGRDNGNGNGGPAGLVLAPGITLFLAPDAGACDLFVGAADAVGVSRKIARL